MSDIQKTLGGTCLEEIRATFSVYKALGDKTFAQLADKEMLWKPDEESNSIAVIIMHISGNFLSRWTDFLTTDGEKPWRSRDAEFEEPGLGKNELLTKWEAGWACLFKALDTIPEDGLQKVVLIRTEPHTVLKALTRSLTHCAYHVGQIVFVAKCIRSGEWKSLSIPRNRSKDFNAKMGMR